MAEQSHDHPLGAHMSAVLDLYEFAKQQIEDFSFFVIEEVDSTAWYSHYLPEMEERKKQLDKLADEAGIEV